MALSFRVALFRVALSFRVALFRVALSEEEPVVERSVTVPPGVGLHARPAALFVAAAAEAAISVTVARPDGTPINAKSILALLGLDVRGGEQVVLRADGPGAQEALDRIARVVTAISPADG